MHCGLDIFVQQTSPQTHLIITELCTISCYLSVCIMSPISNGQSRPMMIAAVRPVAYAYGAPPYLQILATPLGFRPSLHMALY